MKFAIPREKFFKKTYYIGIKIFGLFTDRILLLKKAKMLKIYDKYFDFLVLNLVVRALPF